MTATPASVTESPIKGVKNMTGVATVVASQAGSPSKDEVNVELDNAGRVKSGKVRLGSDITALFERVGMVYWTLNYTGIQSFLTTLSYSNSFYYFIELFYE